MSTKNIALITLKCNVYKFVLHKDYPFIITRFNELMIFYIKKFETHALRK